LRTPNCLYAKIERGKISELQIIPPSSGFMAVGTVWRPEALGEAALLRLMGHGTLSYGLMSWGLFVPTAGDTVFRPRLALRRRSAAREIRPAMLLSFSLRPRVWFAVEFCEGGGRGGPGG
jgi:hypothetical protein